MTYDPQLLTELARCYVQAALTELLRETREHVKEHEQISPMITTRDKDSRTPTAVVSRAGPQR